MTEHISILHDALIALCITVVILGVGVLFKGGDDE